MGITHADGLHERLAFQNVSCVRTNFRAGNIPCELILVQLVHEFNLGKLKPFGDYERMHDLCSRKPLYVNILD